MKICLVIPKGIVAADPSIPHGLLSIVSMAKQHGYSCKIVDCNDPDANSSYEYFNTFDVVGLSVMTTQLRHATEIADNIGKHVRVVWGGVHCLLDPESVINKYKKHFVVSGDGEIPFVKLLNYFAGEESFEELKTQGGISFYQDQPVIGTPFFIKDLNELPDIDYYDLPNLEKYIRDPFYLKSSEKLPSIETITSRGCLWDCSFCINNIYKKHHAFHRSKSFDKVRRETEKIIDDFDIKVVYPRDEDFFAPKRKLFVEQWQEYARQKGFSWGVSCRYNYFKQNMITHEKLKNSVESGLFYIGMSVEAGSEDLRNKVIKKNLTNNEIYTAVETIKQSGVSDRLVINTSFIVDFPGDTPQNKIETVKWMNYLSKNINVMFSGPQIYRPYPGTRLYELEHKHKYGDIEYYLAHIVSSGEFGNEIDFASYFYADALVYYFNWRTRFLQLDKSTGKYKVIRKWSVGKHIGKILFEILFLTIRIRLKLNFWRFFYEPLVIGWIWYSIRIIIRSKFLVHSKLLRKLKK